MQRDSTVAVILKTKVLIREGFALLTCREMTRQLRAAGEKRKGRERVREGGWVGGRREGGRRKEGRE